MGEYFRVVCPDRREFISVVRATGSLKAPEIMSNHNAAVILSVLMCTYGVDSARISACPGGRIPGRWIGAKAGIVGDYSLPEVDAMLFSEPVDLGGYNLYTLTSLSLYGPGEAGITPPPPPDLREWRDITDDYMRWATGPEGSAYTFGAYDGMVPVVNDMGVMEWRHSMMEHPAVVALPNMLAEGQMLADAAVHGLAPMTAATSVGLTAARLARAPVSIGRGIAQALISILERTTPPPPDTVSEALANLRAIIYDHDSPVGLAVARAIAVTWAKYPHLNDLALHQAYWDPRGVTNDTEETG